MNEGNVSSALDVEDASVILVCWRGDVHGLGWCTCGLRETLVGQARVGVDTFPSVGGEGEGHEGNLAMAKRPPTHRSVGREKAMKVMVGMGRLYFATLSGV